MIPYYIRVCEAPSPCNFATLQLSGKSSALSPYYTRLYGMYMRLQALQPLQLFATFGSSGSIRLFSVRLRVAKCASQRTGNYIQMQKTQHPNRGGAMLKHEECIRIQSIQLNLLKQKLSNNTNQKLKE